MTDELKEYIDELYEDLFEVIDKAFPSMEFRRQGSGRSWQSNYRIDGSRASSATSYVYDNNKFCIKDYSASNSVSVIKHYESVNGCDFWTALERLSSLCGKEPYHRSPEAENRQKQRNNNEYALSIMQKALWSGEKEPERVLSYLKGRKWNEDDIKRASLAYVDKDLISRMSPEIQESMSVRLGMDEVGVTHRLVLPVYNGSHIEGFKFRNIDYNNEKGRQRYLNNKGLHKGSSLCYVPIKCKDLIVVEGELDALSAKVRGEANIASTMGSSITRDQALSAMKRGVNTFTLLYDNDERGREFTKPSIAILEELGCNVFIAELAPYNVKDVAEFFELYEEEDWKTLIKQAIPSFLWKCNDIIASANIENFKDIKKLEEDLGKLVNDSKLKPQDREMILCLMKQDQKLKDLELPVLSLEAYYNQQYEIQQALRRKEETDKATVRAQELLKQGRTDEAIKTLKDCVSSVGSMDKAVKYAKLFAIPTKEEIREKFRQRREGLPIGISCGSGKFKERLTLETGLTYVCGATSHGKTAFLNTIALNTAVRNIRLGKKETVLYFSLEVNSTELMEDLLNTFVNDNELGDKFSPIRTIRGYYTGEDDRYFNKQGTAKYRDDRGFIRDTGKEHLKYFQEREEYFLDKVIGEGYLKIIEEEPSVEELVDSIKYYVRTSPDPISLICLDYAQLLRSEDYSRQRTEEIKKVVTDLRVLANENKLTILMGAQFNRQITSILEVDTNNIGEGGDIERSADTIIGLYNLQKLSNNIDANKKRSVIRILNKCFGDHMIGGKLRDQDLFYKEELKDKDLELKPIEGRMYVKILKRRGGQSNLDTVLEFEGKTKRIVLNDPEALLPTPQELPFAPEVKQTGPLNPF